MMAIALLGFLGLFASCEEEETTEPNIEISENTVPDSIEAGVEVTLKFSVIADENLEQIELRKGTNTLDVKTEGFTDRSADTYSYTGVLADTANAGSTLDFALMVTDKDDNQQTHDFQLAVREIDTITVTRYDQKIMGIALQDGTSDDLLSVKNGEVYTYDYVNSNGIKDSADIITAYSDLKAFNYQLISPSNSPDYIHNGGTLPNNTYFKKVTDMTFEEVTGENIADLSGFTNEFVSVGQGDLVAFITEAGHKGYLKVVAIDDPNGSPGDADDDLTLDMKAAMANELP